MIFKTSSFTNLLTNTIHIIIKYNIIDSNSDSSTSIKKLLKIKKMSKVKKSQQLEKSTKTISLKKLNLLTFNIKLVFIKII